MNEEVNFCNQCGVKISSDAKFCSNCGHDLINSSTKISSDKTIKVEVTNAKVEVTNATVEKGFEAIGKVFKKGLKAIEKGVAPGKGLKKVFNEMRYPSQPYGLRVETRDAIKAFIKACVFIGFILLLGLLIKWLYLNT